MESIAKLLENLEKLLADVEAELPPKVYFLGPLLGQGGRISVSNPAVEGPNPIRNHPFSGLGGFDSLIVTVPLFRPAPSARGGWLFNINLVLDEALTAEEVRNRIKHATQVLLDCARGSVQLGRL